MVQKQKLRLHPDDRIVFITIRKLRERYRDLLEEGVDPGIFLRRAFWLQRQAREAAPSIQVVTQCDRFGTAIPYGRRFLTMPIENIYFGLYGKAEERAALTRGIQPFFVWTNIATANTTALSELRRGHRLSPRDYLNEAIFANVRVRANPNLGPYQDPAFLGNKLSTFQDALTTGAIFVVRAGEVKALMEAFVRTPEHVSAMRDVQALLCNDPEFPGGTFAWRFESPTDASYRTASDRLTCFLKNERKSTEDVWEFRNTFNLFEIA